MEEYSGVPINTRVNEQAPARRERFNIARRGGAVQNARVGGPSVRFFNQIVVSLVVSLVVSFIGGSVGRSSLRSIVGYGFIAHSHVKIMNGSDRFAASLTRPEFPRHTRWRG